MSSFIPNPDFTRRLEQLEARAQDAQTVVDLGRVVYDLLFLIRLQIQRGELEG